MTVPVSGRFQQLALRFTDPVQHDYEVIHAIMLADETVAARSHETGMDRETVGEKARRFVQHGMVGLIARRTATTKGQHRYPDVVAAYMLYVTQLYPAMHDHEIAHIVGRTCGYEINHHTVGAFLERHTIPLQPPLPVTGFHVLGPLRGQAVDIGVFRQVLRHPQVSRVVAPRGYVSGQRFYTYAELGPSRASVSVWLYGRCPHVAPRGTLLARYDYRYDRAARRLRAISDLELYRTAYTSPQIELWGLDDAPWRKVMARRCERHPRTPDNGARQLAPPALGMVVSLAALSARGSG